MKTLFLVQTETEQFLVKSRTFIHAIRFVEKLNKKIISISVNTEQILDDDSQ